MIKEANADKDFEKVLEEARNELKGQKHVVRKYDAEDHLFA